MKIKKRQAQIVDYVRQHSKANVDELAKWLAISKETIRRDLSDLASNGKIQKIHGGAALPKHFGEGSFQQRMSENTTAKARIAKAAAALFKAGETLMIDTGSTTLFLAEKLAENWAEQSSLRIISNSTDIANALGAKALAGSNKLDADHQRTDQQQSNKGHQVFLLGGEFNADNRQSIGSMAIAQLRQFRAQHAVLTMAALDSHAAMDFDLHEAELARCMIEQAELVTVLLDHSKFNCQAAFNVCSLNQIDRLVCDLMPDTKLATAIDNAGIELIIAA